MEEVHMSLKIIMKIKWDGEHNSGADECPRLCVRVHSQACVSHDVI